MKNTGIVRSVDHLGRIVLPKELRKSLQLEAGTPLDISVDGDTILLKKHQPECTCAFCGAVDPDSKTLSGLWVCPSCLEKLRSL